MHHFFTVLSNLTLHQVYDYISGFVLASSLLGLFLPPYEWFAPWPKFQAVYKVLTMTVIRWGAINVKSVLYPSIASNGGGNLQSQTGGKT